MKILAKLVLLAALVLPAAYASAQAAAGLSGTIDEVMMDDGVIVISGRRLVVRAADLVITYKGEPVRSSFLDAGMTVQYSTRSDGSVDQITLIGPAAVLEAIQDQ
jgi:hypothetical protein